MAQGRHLLQFLREANWQLALPTCEQGIFMSFRTECGNRNTEQVLRAILDRNFVVIFALSRRGRVGYVLRRASPSPVEGEGTCVPTAKLGTDSITFKPLTLLTHGVIVFLSNGFADRSAERLFNGQVVRRIPADIQRRARV